MNTVSCTYRNRKVTAYTANLTDAAPLVLLHGFCEDSSVWHDLATRNPAWPLVLIDLPGFGGSEPPETPGMDYYAGAVATVLDFLHLKKCILLGHSMGGYTVLACAAQFPERLAAFGLIHSHPYPDTPDRMENRRRGIELLRTGKKDLYTAQLFPNLFAADYATAHPEVLAACIATGRQQPTEGIIAALEGMMLRRDHTDTLRQAVCPVLFVLGKKDNLIPVDDGLRAACLPNVVEVNLLDGVGHMSMLEAPVLLGEIVDAFYIETTWLVQP